MFEKITYKNKEICVYNHKGLYGKKLIDSLKECNEAILKSEKNDNIVISDFTDTIISEEAMAIIKSEETKLTNKKIKKSCVVGIEGVKKIMLKGVNLFFQDFYHPCDNMYEAKEWITKES
jgi:hypothetical protein